MAEDTEAKKVFQTLKYLKIGFAVLLIFSISLAFGLVWISIKVDYQLEKCTCEHTKLGIMDGEKADVLKPDARRKDSTLTDEKEMPREEREVISTSHGISDMLKAIQGIQGPAGRDGLPGLPGNDGKDGRDGRDAVNINEVNRQIDALLSSGVDKEMTKVRQAIKQMPAVSGRTFTRWGRTSCPSSADLVMKGIAAGTMSTLSGGSAEYICLPDDPDHVKTSTLPGAYHPISGVEYESTLNELFGGKSLHNHNAPCAICQTRSRTALQMFPAKTRCPDAEWTLEYQGYLMTGWGGHKSRTQYVCVDAGAETIPGLAHDTDGARWYHVVPSCAAGNGYLGYCPPYESNSVLGCVICSK